MARFSDQPAIRLAGQSNHKSQRQDARPDGRNTAHRSAVDQSEARRRRRAEPDDITAAATMNEKIGKTGGTRRHTEKQSYACFSVVFASVGTLTASIYLPNCTLPCLQFLCRTHYCLTKLLHCVHYCYLTSDTSFSPGGLNPENLYHWLGNDCQWVGNCPPS